MLCVVQTEQRSCIDLSASLRVQWVTVYSIYHWEPWIIVNIYTCNKWQHTICYIIYILKHIRNPILGNPDGYLWPSYSLHRHIFALLLHKFQVTWRFHLQTLLFSNRGWVIDVQMCITHYCFFSYLPISLMYEDICKNLSNQTKAVSGLTS